MKRTSVGILGAGTWGIALARLLANAGHGVTVWSRATVDALLKTNAHPKLPQAKLPETIAYTKSISDALRGAEAVVFAVPSVAIRETARAARPYIEDSALVIDASKGIEASTLLTLTEVIEDELKNPALSYVALSGPTHAEEVALDLPTTVVAASENPDAARKAQELFRTPRMRVYANPDRKGVEIAGALKNIIALAAGISDGLGFGDNAKAALITRGLAELARMGEKLGCNPSTFAGLAGVGDLVVTATSRHSRNCRCGFLIGSGLAPDKAAQEVGMVVEGINALPAAIRLARINEVETPIIDAVDAIVFRGEDPALAVEKLFNRDQKEELQLPRS